MDIQISNVQSAEPISLLMDFVKVVVFTMLCEMLRILLKPILRSLCILLKSMLKKERESYPQEGEEKKEEEKSQLLQQQQQQQQQHHHHHHPYESLPLLTFQKFQEKEFSINDVTSPQLLCVQVLKKKK